MTGCYVWSLVQSARFWIIIWSILIWSILKVLVDRNCFLLKWWFFSHAYYSLWRVKAEKLILGLMNTVVLWTASSGFEAFFRLLWVEERSICVNDLLIHRGKSKEAKDTWQKWCNYIKKNIECEVLRVMRNMLNNCLHQIKDEAKQEGKNAILDKQIWQKGLKTSWRTKCRLRRRKDHMEGREINLALAWVKY